MWLHIKKPFANARFGFVGEKLPIMHCQSFIELYQLQNFAKLDTIRSLYNDGTFLSAKIV